MKKGMLPCFTLFLSDFYAIMPSTTRRATALMVSSSRPRTQARASLCGLSHVECSLRVEPSTHMHSFQLSSVSLIQGP